MQAKVCKKSFRDIRVHPKLTQLCAIFAAILLHLCGGCSSESWSDNPENSEDSIHASKVRGDSVCNMLAVYYSKYGSYPDSLSAIENDLGVMVTQPTAGVKMWRYAASSDGRDYTLTLCLTPNCYPCYWISSATHPEWRSDF